MIRSIPKNANTTTKKIYYLTKKKKKKNPKLGYFGLLHISIQFRVYGSIFFFIMWRLVRGNILEFPGMFKDSYVWLQITLGNLMPRESGFPL